MNFESTLEAVTSLSIEQQLTLMSIVQNRLIDQRRSEIAYNAEEALKEFNMGKLQSYEIGDLIDILHKNLEEDIND